MHICDRYVPPFSKEEKKVCLATTNILQLNSCIYCLLRKFIGSYAKKKIASKGSINPIWAWCRTRDLVIFRHIHDSLFLCCYGKFLYLKDLVLFTIVFLACNTFSISFLHGHMPLKHTTYFVLIYVLEWDSFESPWLTITLDNAKHIRIHKASI